MTLNLHSTVRQLVDSYHNLDELKYAALIGRHADNTNNPPIAYKIVYGESPTLVAGTETQIWPTATAMAFPKTAETLSVVSSSADDDGSGIGTDLVNIEGLDGDYLPISEAVFLDGLTPVTSTLSFLHITEMSVANITSTGNTNAGNITVTQSTSGDLLGYLALGDSISQQSQFTVPAGYTALLLSFHTGAYNASGSGAKRAEVQLTFCPQTGAGTDIDYKTLKASASSEAGLSEDEFHLPLMVQEKVAIVPRCTSDSNNAIITCSYELVLIKSTNMDPGTVF